MRENSFYFLCSFEGFDESEGRFVVTRDGVGPQQQLDILDDRRRSSIDLSVAQRQAHGGSFSLPELWPG